MIDFECRIRRSPRRRTLSICVYPDNTVVVAAPEKLSQKEIMSFVERKADWVRKRMQINLEKQEDKPQRRYVTGEKLLCLGKEYTLVIEEGRPVGVALNGENISVRIPSGTPAELRGRMVRRQLMLWYARLAAKKIEERVRHYAGLIGVWPRSVKLKSLRSRWGSCSTRGGINFAWNIIMAGEPILDYLVVHELCHLVHHNHSPEYWKLVASYVPDHLQKRKWLRENGQTLIL